MRGLLLALVLAALASGTAHAQDAPARVDYVAGGTIYLRVADGSFWLPGDTIRIAAAAAADWTGRARVLGAAAARLSVEWLSGPIPFAVGDSVRVERVRAAPPAVVPADEPAEPARPPAEPLPAPRERTTSRGGLRAHGRVGVEVDALASASEWAGSTLDRTSVINTLRLRGMVSGLPAGLRLRANLRGSYRHEDASALGAPTVLYANELSLERTGTRLQFQAGRFGSSYEPYSGAWDGALLRLGRMDGLGVGAAYGLDPRYGNQGIEPERRKATLFLDVHRAGAALRYDADLSAHRIWEGDTTVATALGWTQQLSLRGVRLTQLLRVDDGADGWTLGLAQLSAAVPLAPSLRLRLRLGHDDPHTFYQLPADATWRRRSAGGTLAWYGTGINAGIDATATLSERGARADSAAPRERRTASSFGAWVDVPRTFAAGVGFDVHASTWAGYGQRTLSLAPGLRRTFGRSSLRTGYQFHRYEHDAGDTDTHAVSGSFSSALGRGQLDLAVRHDWGGGLRSTRLLSGVWVTL